MATPRICLDTSILIDFSRKTNKQNTVIFQLSHQYRFSISVISAFEVQVGIKSAQQMHEYDQLMKEIEILPLDLPCIEQAVKTYHELKSKNAQIGLADLLIGTTALRYQLALATLNEKHFSRIQQLQIVKI